jgi:protein-disulfide isomerase
MAVVAAMIALVATDDAKKTRIDARQASSIAATIQSLIGGIPQSGDVLGNRNAPVTLRYFGDLECPFCREFTLGALPTLIQKWVRTGKLRIEYRSMETATREPEVFTAQQVAALAAGRQNKMWYFLELFYHEQGEEGSGYVTEQYLRGLAQQVPGLDLPRWKSDRNDPKLVSQVALDVHLAKRLGTPGTPGLFFGTTGGTLTLQPSVKLTDPNRFNETIELLLASG